MIETKVEKEICWGWLIQTFLVVPAILIWIGSGSLFVWAISWLLYAICLILNFLVFNKRRPGHNVKAVINKLMFFASSFVWGGLLVFIARLDPFA